MQKTIHKIVTTVEFSPRKTLEITRMPGSDGLSFHFFGSGDSYGGFKLSWEELKVFVAECEALNSGKGGAK